MQPAPGTHVQRAQNGGLVALLLPSRWLRRSALRVPIPRLPTHLGLALGDEPIDMKQLADLVGWCADLGIHRITLCDAHGTLLQAPDRVGETLSGYLSYPLAVVWPDGKWAAPPQSPAAPQPSPQPVVSLNLTSLQAGRDDLVNAARQLCEIGISTPNPPPVDEAAVGRQLKAHAGWPDPVSARLCASARHPKRHSTRFPPALDPDPAAQELVLQLCPELMLGGLLPWHSRVTTFVHMGPLRCASRAGLHMALLEFGGVTQRYGK